MCFYLHSNLLGNVIRHDNIVIEEQYRMYNTVSHAVFKTLLSCVVKMMKISERFALSSIHYTRLYRKEDKKCIISESNEDCLWVRVQDIVQANEQKRQRREEKDGGEEVYNEKDYGGDDSQGSSSTLVLDKLIHLLANLMASRYNEISNTDKIINEKDDKA